MTLAIRQERQEEEIPAMEHAFQRLVLFSRTVGPAPHPFHQHFSIWVFFNLLTRYLQQTKHLILHVSICLTLRIASTEMHERVSAAFVLCVASGWL